MIKNRYALNENEELVDIQTLTNADRKDYVCVGCRAILRPVLAGQRKRHFRHKVDAECNGETYLHLLGKKVFEETYRSCLTNNKPFEVSFNQYKLCTYCPQQGPCGVGSFDIVKYDLVPLFRDMVVEKSDDRFIPDITLRHSSGEPLYIEIAVSHKCSDEKFKSGKRIIEITLKDEEDVNVIYSRHLYEQDGRIDFYNFKHFIRGDFSSLCSKTAHVFIVEASGKCSMKTMKWLAYERIQKIKGIYTSRLESNDKRLFSKAVEQAHLDGAKPRSCSICKHHTRATLSQMAAAGGRGSVYCAIAKTTFNPVDALKCGEYTPDRKVFTYLRLEEK